MNWLEKERPGRTWVHLAAVSAAPGESSKTPHHHHCTSQIMLRVHPKYNEYKKSYLIINNHSITDYEDVISNSKFKILNLIGFYWYGKFKWTWTWTHGELFSSYFPKFRQSIDYFRNSATKYTACTLKLRPVKLLFVVFGHLSYSVLKCTCSVQPIFTLNCILYWIFDENWQFWWDFCR